MDRSKWEYKKLGDIALVSAGQGAPQGEHNYSPDGTPFVKAGNIESLVNGLSEYDIQKVNDEVVKSHRLKLYKAGSVLFAKSGMSCMKGLIYTLKNDCYVVSHLAIVTPKDINSHYLNYYFQVHKPNLLIKDSAYPSISLKDIENMDILCPSQTDQQRIVAELDCLNEMIAVKKEQLKEFDKLAQSIFYDMFGDPVANPNKWESVTLERLIQDSIILYHLDGNHGGDYPRREEFVEQGVPYIGANNIKDGYIDFSAIKYLTEKKASTLRKGIAKNEDILFAHNATVGPVAILRTAEERVVLSTSLTAYRCNKQRLLPLFLKSYMESTWFVSQYIHTMKQATRNQVPITQQRKMTFILPPLSLQQQFAEKISAIEAQKELVKQSIAETQHLLDYTMDKYFG